MNATSIMATIILKYYILQLFMYKCEHVHNASFLIFIKLLRLWHNLLPFQKKAYLKATKPQLLQQWNQLSESQTSKHVHVENSLMLVGQKHMEEKFFWVLELILAGKLN